MKYLLIWDIDGTLITMKGTSRKAMNITFKEIYGIEDALKGINMAGGVDFAIVSKVLSAHKLKIDNLSKFFNKHCENLRAEVKKVPLPITCPGIPELLDAIHRDGRFYNVLGTGNIEEGARIKLEPAGLNRYFPTGGFGDEAMERKQLIEEAVANASIYFDIKFENRNIYVIGDTPKDIECGKISNTKTIGVATGDYSLSELSQCRPDYLFENLYDAQEFLSIFE